MYKRQIWAVIAPNINVSTGAVALICAGLYVTNGNKSSDAVKISIGFLLGDFWAVFALKIMDVMNFNADMELFITLFVLGGLAVLISACLPKWIFTPAWLCGCLLYTSTIEKAAAILLKVLAVRPDKLQTITPDNFRHLAKDFNVNLPEEFLYEK